MRHAAIDDGEGSGWVGGCACLKGWVARGGGKRGVQEPILIFSGGGGYERKQTQMMKKGAPLHAVQLAHAIPLPAAELVAHPDNPLSADIVHADGFEVRCDLGPVGVGRRVDGGPSVKERLTTAEGRKGGGRSIAGAPNRRLFSAACAGTPGTNGPTQLDEYNELAMMSMSKACPPPRLTRSTRGQ